MNEEEVRRILSRVGAFITDGHFIYTSDKHGSKYINKDAIYPHTEEVSRLCRGIADKFIGDSVEVVIAPAIGGVILSQWVAHWLTKMTGREVLSTYAEKEGMELVSSSCGTLPPRYEDIFVIKRGYDKLIFGKNILVVEDILTTGGTVKKVVKITRDFGVNVIGVGALFNRGFVLSKDVGDILKVVSLMNLRFDSWDREVCPLCAKGILVNTEVGKGHSSHLRKKLSI